MPPKGAASRLGSRLGLRRQGSSGPSGSRALSTIQDLASQMCAQRGFDIASHGSLPSGGTIFSVDELNFDRALVLLSLFKDARVYGDATFVAPSGALAALSLRVASRMANTRLFESVVRDLANQRTVLMSSTHCEELRRTRTLLRPARRVCVELQSEGRVQVLVEA